ncbi:Fic family protein [Mycobacterium hackensackense]|uniref:Fic family protein n=1 Tax=Mycobacterium hackensackense TaxID=228909 RepID=UPI002265B49E|nr:Fic family protein [Mycobacterium hackensackense]MCV7254166.1 Fic family protein [Mycobacterium hackensackense]
MGDKLYQTTHPWITFEFADGRYDTLSVRLGEAFSKCAHMAGTPLQPGLAAKLAQVYLIKGVSATTAIEGNTLTETEVTEILEDRRNLPPSQEYLQREVENMERVLRGVDVAAQRSGGSWRVTPDWLKTQNRAILDGIPDDDHVVPGEYTTKQLLVGSVYRAAPPEDVPYLVERLCDWINEMLNHVFDKNLDADKRFFQAFYAAVLSHLYIAWIHPFGNGNGRTAGALECAILAHSHLVPWVSSSLLSDHYNRTRNRYYSKLDAASRKGDVIGLIAYAADGFVDQLREQIALVQIQQRQVAWVNYVHEVFQYETQGETSKRRRTLLLSLPENQPTPRSRLRRLTPELAEMYAHVGDRALSHDTGKLRSLGLLEGDAKSGFYPAVHLMDAFTPGKQPLDGSEWIEDPVTSAANEEVTVDELFKELVVLQDSPSGESAPD